jgi:hypothetical protein
MADNNSTPKAAIFCQQDGNLGGKSRKAIPWNKNKEMASFIISSIGSYEFAKPLPMLLRW